MKTGSCFAIGSAIAGRSLAQALAGGRAIAIAVAPEDSVASAEPSMWALGMLKAALEARGASVRVVRRPADAKAREFAIASSSSASHLSQAIFEALKIQAPTEPEALCLAQGHVEGIPVLLASGTDARGLVYALTELADRVSCLGTGDRVLDFGTPVREQPASRIRSVMRGFCSEVEDKEWFHDRNFWAAYLTTLVSSRLNRFSLSLGMGYNSASGVTDGYFVFPYPFLISVPGFDVRAGGLSEAERDRNLETLRFIGRECARRGLLFQLGLWTLAYAWPNSPKATYRIQGLTDDTHSAYCRAALGALLRAVPEITGVTFRVHEESGIPQGHEDFWKVQFSAIADCGRRVEIDMHAKNMSQATLDRALATGQPVVVSPKYCGEHLSLPYPPASIREIERGSADKLTDTGSGLLVGDRGFTRYGYADMLSENRTWDVVFRIWPGTQRFLLSGDPALFSGYGRNASFCGAAGIELSEPLHFKGRAGSGRPGGRCGYADSSLIPRHDFEKYLYTYRLWGRLGYNPDADPGVWRRALSREFGSAARAVEQALAPVSRVLPLITLAHAPSANCVLYWPEIYTNMAVADETQKHPYGDTRSPRLFGNASSFDPQLFQSPDECAGALLDGKATGKYTPLEVAQWLDDIAASSAAAISEAREKLGSEASAPPFRRIEEDVLILCGIALFFAGKLRCGVLWRIHADTGSRVAGEAAIGHYRRGRNAWDAMAARAKQVYLPSIPYGGSRSLHGHWADRVAAFDEDIADLQARLAASSPIPETGKAGVAKRAIELASARTERPPIVAVHKPADRFRPGSPLSVTTRIGPTAPKRVSLHYRHVDQAETWQSVDLRSSDGAYSGEIPAEYTARRFALQYFFEIETAQGAATLSPLLAHDLSNLPYHTVRRSAS